MERKDLHFDNFLRSFIPRHSILIEPDLRQFNGQKVRIDALETLCSHVRECDSVRNFNLVTYLFKSKQVKLDCRNNVAIISNYDM